MGACVVDGLSDDIWLLFASPKIFDWWMLVGIVVIEGIVYVEVSASVGIFASIEVVVRVEGVWCTGDVVKEEGVV
jgi:hypothetical protein